MSKIIGISGEMGAGKSTLASMITDNIKGSSCVMSFAQPVKDIASIAVGNWPKGAYLKKYDITIAKLYQIIGTDMFRDMVHPDVWVDYLVRKLVLMKTLDYSYKTIVIDDVRFQNEVDWIKANNGWVIEIKRDTTPETSGRDTSHKSEHGITSLDPHFTVVNNLGLDVLEKEAQVLCNTMVGK